MNKEHVMKKSLGEIVIDLLKEIESSDTLLVKGESYYNCDNDDNANCDDFYDEEFCGRSEISAAFFEREYDNRSKHSNYWLNKKFKSNDILVEYVASHGGEDRGRDYWSVYKFTKDQESCFVKFDGWYASYVGSEFEEYFLVEQYQVSVTKYRKI